MSGRRSDGRPALAARRHAHVRQRGGPQRLGTGEGVDDDHHRPRSPVGTAGLGASYGVAADAKGNQSHQAGAVYTLAYRGEATFDAASNLAGQTFKIQVSRTADGVADPADSRWTDLALYDAANPSANAVVEHTITVAQGKTVGLDLFADLGHRGRIFFRVLTKKSGGGAASGTHAFAAWVTG